MVPERVQFASLFATDEWESDQLIVVVKHNKSSTTTTIDETRTCSIHLSYSPVCLRSGFAATPQ
jgi:hypothetical protein